MAVASSSSISEKRQIFAYRVKVVSDMQPALSLRPVNHSIRLRGGMCHTSRKEHSRLECFDCWSFNESPERLLPRFLSLPLLRLPFALWRVKKGAVVVGDTPYKAGEVQHLRCAGVPIVRSRQDGPAQGHPAHLRSQCALHQPSHFQPVATPVPRAAHSPNQRCPRGAPQAGWVVGHVSVSRGTIPKWDHGGIAMLLQIPWC